MRWFGPPDSVCEEVAGVETERSGIPDGGWTADGRRAERARRGHGYHSVREREKSAPPPPVWSRARAGNIDGDGKLRRRRRPERSSSERWSDLSSDDQHYWFPYEITRATPRRSGRPGRSSHRHPRASPHHSSRSDGALTTSIPGPSSSSSTGSTPGSGREARISPQRTKTSPIQS